LALSRASWLEPASATFLDRANSCPGHRRRRSRRPNATLANASGWQATPESETASKSNGPNDFCLRGAVFHQFEMTKHSEPSNSAASSSAAHTTEIESHRLSLFWIMNPLPSRQRLYSGNSLLFHRECKKWPVCELGHGERRGRGRRLRPTGSSRPANGTLEPISATRIHFQLLAALRSPRHPAGHGLN
jgi:hypothetical protein